MHVVFFFCWCNSSITSNATCQMFALSMPMSSSSTSTSSPCKFLVEGEFVGSKLTLCSCNLSIKKISALPIKKKKKFCFVNKFFLLIKHMFALSMPVSSSSNSPSPALASARWRVSLWVQNSLCALVTINKANVCFVNQFFLLTNICLLCQCQ